MNVNTMATTSKDSLWDELTLKTLREGVDVKRIEKAVVLQKPEGWDGGVEVQEKLFDIIVSRFIWLCLRVEIDERGLMSDQKKKWNDRYSTFDYLIFVVSIHFRQLFGKTLKKKEKKLVSLHTYTHTKSFFSLYLIYFNTLIGFSGKNVCDFLNVACDSYSR